MTVVAFYDIPPYELPLKARSSLIPRIQTWLIYHGFFESLETALNKPEHNILRRYFLQARVNTLKNKFTTRFHLALQLNMKLGDQGVNNHDF